MAYHSIGCNLLFENVDFFMNLSSRVERLRTGIFPQFWLVTLLAGRQMQSERTLRGTQGADPFRHPTIFNHYHIERHVINKLP